MNEVGSVHVMFGSGMVITTASWNNPNPGPNDRFGSALAIGDVDGNGYADLAIGTPENDRLTTDDGAVYLYRREAASWLTVTTWDLEDIDDTLIAGPDDEFGTALAMLDEPNTHMTFLYMPTVTKLTPAP
jgi:hypothetical protein